MVSKRGVIKTKEKKLKWFQRKSLRNIVLFILTFIVIYQVIAIITYSPNRQQVLGITYSKKHAEFLGLDWRDTYIKLLDELQVKYVRLPIYWDDVETIQNNYHFNDIDWQLMEAAKRNIHVTLVLGARQPRWPECHLPEWTKTLSPGQYRDEIFRIVALEAQRYSLSSVVEEFQVENEPLLDLFGECPTADKNMLRQEIDIVKAVSDKPIVLTGSGELAPWYYESKWSDIFGSTLYRVTWNKYIGYSSYWMIPSSLYRVKAFIFGKDISKFWISELQMEPWFPGGNVNVPLDEQYRSMSPKQLQKNLNYAYQTNAPRIYLWGAEWWVYTKEVLKTDEIWDVVKGFNW